MSKADRFSESVPAIRRFTSPRGGFVIDVESTTKKSPDRNDAIIAIGKLFRDNATPEQWSKVFDDE